MNGAGMTLWTPRVAGARGPGYLKVYYDRKQVKDAPSSASTASCPTGEEEAILRLCGLACEPVADGARLMARR